MSIQIQLHDMSESTQFAPLGVLGYCLTRTNFLKDSPPDRKFVLNEFRAKRFLGGT
jgi:hypothetical protein